VPKFTVAERTLVRSVVASLSIKRILDPDIMEEIYRQTRKTITKVSLYYKRQQIKKESHHWYKAMREWAVFMAQEIEIYNKSKSNKLQNEFSFGIFWFTENNLFSHNFSADIIFDYIFWFTFQP
jgi:hypothetical protein